MDFKEFLSEHMLLRAISLLNPLSSVCVYWCLLELRDGTSSSASVCDNRSAKKYENFVTVIAL
jgi:hypothetical protein